MAIHLTGSSTSSTSTTNSKTEEVKVSTERYIVKGLVQTSGRGKTKKEFVGAWMGVLRRPDTAWLSEAEIDAIKTTLGRKTFDRHYMSAFEVETPGRSWYFVAVVDGEEDLPDVKKLIDAALKGKAPKADKPKAEDVVAAQERSKKNAADKKAAGAKAKKTHAIVLG